MSEALIHRAVADYLRLALPPNVAWTTFPAGGKRPKATGGQLKGAGLQAGWPDIQVIAGGQYIGIELKSASGKLSPQQRAVHDAIQKAGGLVLLARSIDDVRAGLCAAGIALREAAARNVLAAG